MHGLINFALKYIENSKENQRNRDCQAIINAGKYTARHEFPLDSRDRNFVFYRWYNNTKVTHNRCYYHCRPQLVRANGEFFL